MSEQSSDAENVHSAAASAFTRARNAVCHGALHPTTCVRQLDCAILKMRCISSLELSKNHNSRRTSIQLVQPNASTVLLFTVLCPTSCSCLHLEHGT